MPPSRNILSRRLSSYDPSIYNPPAILRPSASRFYSWPRPPCVILPPVINSPDSESAQPSPPQRAPKVAPKPAALKAAAIEDCFTDGSEGEEELDELANDDQEECDEVDQREEDPEPSSSNQRGTVRPTIARAIAVADQSANKSSLRRRPVVQQAAFGVFDAEEGSPDSTSSQPSSSRSGKPSTNQVGPSRASVAPEVAEDDARDASVGPSLARSGYNEHTLSFTVNPKTTQEQVVDFKCTRSEGSDAVKAPPVGASVDRAAGDVHIHVCMGGVQMWVIKKEKWTVAQEGDPHPTFGRCRVLSHREPRSSKLPNWVLHSTFVTYQSRKRQGLM